MDLKSLNAIVYDSIMIRTGSDESERKKNSLFIAITYDSKQQYRHWQIHDIPELSKQLLSYDKIIGFNNNSHYSTLEEHNPGISVKLKKKSLDIMEVVKNHLAYDITLDNLVSSTLEVERNITLQTIADWFMWGEYKPIAEYCGTNVEVIKDLFLYGLKKKEVSYEHNGAKHILKIDWLSEAEQTSSGDFTYVLNDEENGRQIRLDPNNKEFFQALELVRTTTKHLFITGKAGTGKTTFLKYVSANIAKNTVIVAYTGVAAVNAGGQTIHSFFNINPQEPPFTPWDNRLRLKKDPGDVDDTTIFNHFTYNNAKRQTLKSLELLIIDEVSMVRADFLDVIDKILRAFGPKKELPFGGVQVLLIGDTFQLPPIEGREWDILGDFYSSPFFFSAQVFNDTQPLQIELKKIYRQNELEFINLLNRIRVNRPIDQDLELLNRKVRSITNKDFDDNFIVLCSTNQQVGQINTTRLSTLVGEEKTFDGKVSGRFSSGSYPTDLSLTLKEGAQVMFLKNGPGYYNGKIGTVTNLENGELLVKIRDQRGEEKIVLAEKHTWENVIFSFNPKTRKIEREVIGTFTQYPLKLAWAITIHKSQGLTFEKVAIDINDFAPSGLAYVALSRCTSLNGLALKQPLKRKAINTDPRVIEYAESVAPETLITEILNECKADDLYATARQELKEGDLSAAYSTFLTALKYRNDMETDAFFRYISWLLHGRMFYQNLAAELLDNNHQYEETIRNLTEELETSKKDRTKEVEKWKKKLKEKENETDVAMLRVEDLNDQRNNYQNELRHLRSEYEKILLRVDVLEVDKQRVVSTNATLIKKAETAENQAQRIKGILRQREDELVISNKKLEETEAKLNQERKEKTRLAKITWLQKLFGKT